MPKSRSAQEEKDVYCVCRGPHADRFMIKCNECQEWYHGDCVKITEAQSKKMNDYTCGTCTMRMDITKRLMKKPAPKQTPKKVKMAGETAPKEEPLQKLEKTTSNVNGAKNNALKERDADGKPIYCLCRMPKNGQFMVQCYDCREWFHGPCIKITALSSKALNGYSCDKCKTAEPKQARKKAIAKKRQPTQRKGRKQNAVSPINVVLRTNKKGSNSSNSASEMPQDPTSEVATDVRSMSPSHNNTPTITERVKRRDLPVKSRILRRGPITDVAMTAPSETVIAAGEIDTPMTPTVTTPAHVNNESMETADEDELINVVDIESENESSDEYINVVDVENGRESNDNDTLSKVVHCDGDNVLEDVEENTSFEERANKGCVVLLAPKREHKCRNPPCQQFIASNVNFCSDDCFDAGECYNFGHLNELVQVIPATTDPLPPSPQPLKQTAIVAPRPASIRGIQSVINAGPKCTMCNNLPAPGSKYCSAKCGMTWAQQEVSERGLGLTWEATLASLAEPKPEKM